MTLTDQLQQSLPIDPAALKAKRLEKGLSINYISARLKLPASTLLAVEDGDMRAMEPILYDWARIIKSAPERLSWWRRFIRSPWATAVELMLAALMVGPVVHAILNAGR